LWRSVPINLSIDELRIFYDGQLKKILAYLAAAISSFLAELTIFSFVVEHPIVDLLFLPLLGIGFLWIFQCFLAISIVAKFQELVILERELGIRRFYRSIKTSRFFFAKKLDQFFEKTLGTKHNRDAWDPKRMNKFLNIVTIIVIGVATFLFLYIEVALCLWVSN